MFKVAGLLQPRLLMPLMFGLILGFTFSLFCAPFYDCNQRLVSRASNYTQLQLDLIRSRLKNLQLSHEQLLHQQIDDFEPRIILQNNPELPNQFSQKPVRPRYLSTELGIRKQIFIAVIASKRHLSNDYVTVLNETLTGHVDRLVFFINNPDLSEDSLIDSVPAGINVVNFDDRHDSLLPFHVLKYIQDNYLPNYDWFFLVNDSSFVRASKLIELISHVSITQDLYMGYSVENADSTYCSLKAGILFSNTMLYKLQANMDWCTKNAFAVDASENIGKCVMYSTSSKCTHTANGYKANYHLDASFNSESRIGELLNSSYFNQSLTVGSITDIRTMRLLQIYFAKVEMDEIMTKIAKTEVEIMETVCETPEGCHSLKWPLGVPPPYKAINRHEIIRWDYFNSTHVFFVNDYEVVNEMSEHWKQDVTEAIEFAIKELNKESKSEYRLFSIINGYRQFEAGRGASYILDLELTTDTQSHQRVHKRLNVFRPLGLMEILPMPYTTESTQITLVVCFGPEHEPNQITAFFNSYEQNIVKNKDTADKIDLFVVSLSTAKAKLVAEAVDRIKKSAVASGTKTNVLHAANFSVDAKSPLDLNENHRQLALLEFVSGQLEEDALVFVGSPCIEIDAEFLNRVRLNTLKGRQVFFPIPFSEFMPSLIYPHNQTRPDTVVINKMIGHFDTASFAFSSFYNGDFMESRRLFFTKRNSAQPKVFKLPPSVYDMFTANTRLHLLRATDQSFKCRWHVTQHCEAQTDKELCLSQRQLGTGTKAQLATYLIQNYKTFFGN